MADPTTVTSLPDPSEIGPEKTFEVQLTYLQSISSGIKTVEGRCRDGKYLGMNVGDIVKFVLSPSPRIQGEIGQQQPNPVLCKILRIQPYDKFQDMLEAEGLQNCLPGIPNVAEGVKIYHSFNGYEEKAAKHGVIAFQVQLLT